MKKVAFTVYPVTDVARAWSFYEDTLGLAVGMAGGQGDMHWVEHDLPAGGCFAITNTTGEQPSAGAGGTIALEVFDLERVMSRSGQPSRLGRGRWHLDSFRRRRPTTQEPREPA